MQEFIGVKSSYSVALYPSLKREALMFNRIAIHGIEGLLKFLPNRTDGLGDFFAKELNYLIERGIVFEPEYALLDEKLQSHEEFKKYRNLYDEQGKQTVKILEAGLGEGNTESRLEDSIKNDIVRLYMSSGGDRFMDNTFARISKSANKEGFAGVFRESFAYLYLSLEYRARLMSIQLRELSGMQAFPILTTGIETLQEKQASKADVIQIVFNALPVPDDSVSWEQIMDYRNDPDAAGDFSILRRWMSKVVRDIPTPNEIEEELESLIYQYQRHMRLHKMKFTPGVLQTLVVGGGEVLENLVKRNFGKLAKGLFFLRNRQISLLEGELTAPGNEIAYIVKVKDRFS